MFFWQTSCGYSLELWKFASEEIPIRNGTRFVYLLCLKYSTWRSRFAASSRVLYGPPKFFPFSEVTLYPAFTFLIMTFLPPAQSIAITFKASIRFAL
jgi:hypothetical protein